jgi:hypothetical protein
VKLPLTVTSLAVSFTDKTCREVTGADWGPVRRWCEANGVPVVHVGRRPTVLVARYAEALDRAGGAKPRSIPTEEEFVRRISGVK